MNEQTIKNYMRNIKNAKKVKKLLEKSWMRPKLLNSCNYIIKNYKLEDEETWLWEFCNKNKIGHISCYNCVYEPIKVTNFSEPYLQLVKKRIENWNADERLTSKWKYDYSIHIDWKKWWYNREYKWCGNGYYYLLLDHEHALFYEKD